MLLSKKIHLTATILYVIVAVIGSQFLNIAWEDGLTLLFLSAIFYHILEWKYDWVEYEEEEEDASY